MSGLESYTVEELVKELERRCEAIVIGMSLLTDARDEKPVRLRFGGKRLVGRGIIADLLDHSREPASWELEERP